LWLNNIKRVAFLRTTPGFKSFSVRQNYFRGTILTQFWLGFYQENALFEAAPKKDEASNKIKVVSGNKHSNLLYHFVCRTKV
jgi:hypothetical protein